MTERIVMINNKIYSLKFGMKSLIVFPKLIIQQLRNIFLNLLLMIAMERQ